MQVAGKTDWNFGMQINEHCELDKISPLFNLFTECKFYQYYSQTCIRRPPLGLLKSVRLVQVIIL